MNYEVNELSDILLKNPHCCCLNNNFLKKNIVVLMLRCVKTFWINITILGFLISLLYKVCYWNIPSKNCHSLDSIYCIILNTDEEIKTPELIWFIYPNKFNTIKAKLRFSRLLYYFYFILIYLMIYFDTVLTVLNQF